MNVYDRTIINNWQPLARRHLVFSACCIFPCPKEINNAALPLLLFGRSALKADPERS
jgi:hypothetical protein